MARGPSISDGKPGITLFSAASGRVTAFTDSSLPAVAAVSLEGFGEFIETRSIITRVGFSGQANANFRHTVGGAVHIYTFGDRIGEAIVSGLCFDSGCGQNEFSGLDRIARYFNRNRVSERADPLALRVGTKLTLLSYLISVTVDIAETTSRVYQYTFKLMTVPEPQRIVPGNVGGGGGAGQGGNVPVSPAMLGIQVQVPTSTSPGSYQTPGWASTPSTDIGGAHGAPNTIGMPAGGGFANFGTGPNTQLSRGYN